MKPAGCTTSVASGNNEVTARTTGSMVVPGNRITDLPAAMRIAVPEANPALSIGAALGVTFPFNLLLGIPVYHWLATMIDGGVR